MNPSVALMSQFIDTPVKSPSPAGNWLGAILKVVKEGYLEVELTVKKEHTNPIGTLHGGVAALIIDEFAGACLFTLNNKDLHVSQNLYVDYFKPAREGDLLTIKAELIRKGSKIINVECSIYNHENLLLTKGVGNLINTGKPNPFNN